VEALRENHYHVVWIPEEGADPGDTQILNRAFQEKRVLVTADNDFGDLVFVFQQPHPAIIRLVNLKAKA
jgi:predicted nuclease of predicted toxin-antitoxin system